MLHLGENQARNKVNVLKKVKVDGQWKLCRQSSSAVASSKIECRSTAAPKCTTKVFTTLSGPRTANAVGNQWLTATTFSNVPVSNRWNWITERPGFMRMGNLLLPNPLSYFCLLTQ